VVSGLLFSKENCWPKPSLSLFDREKAIAQWRRILIRLQKIRRLQRYFGHIGQVLQWFPSDLRKALQREYPKQ
jgi:hypothetical protein